MKKIKYFSLILIFSLLLLNCKKPKQPVITDGVYLAGAKDDNFNLIPTIWQSGTATELANAGNESTARSIVVDGADLFTVGDWDNTSLVYNIAAIWKNGVKTNLTDGSKRANAYSVFVNGSDVYVAGFESNGSNDIAKIWKNGVATNLSNGSNSAEARGVFVVGADVYAAGFESGDAILWKNGVKTILSTGSGSSAWGYSLFVSGADVYVAGIQYPSFGANLVAKLWKNGVVTNLSDGTDRAEATSVYVHGTDVYVGGQDSTYAVVWKNGVVNKLSNGVSPAFVSSVFVTDAGDVFAAGYEIIGSKSYGRVWKNNNVYFAEDEESSFSSVFVKE